VARTRTERRVADQAAAEFLTAYQGFIAAVEERREVEDAWKRALQKGNSARALWDLGSAVALREARFHVGEAGFFREGKILKVGQMPKPTVGLRRGPSARGGSIHLPGGDPGRGKAGGPPPGCIGPPDPIPLHDNEEMAFVVRDCAGVDIDKAAVERLVYMLRRAHGIGLAEGMSRGKKAPKKRPRANPVSSGIMRRALRGT